MPPLPDQIQQRPGHPHQLRNTRFRAVASLSRRRTLTCWVPLESFRHALLHGFPFLQALPGGISAETSRRIACDASIVEMQQDEKGNVLDVGRKTRTIPPAIRRALDARDPTCVWPGCESTFVQGHHLEFWAAGGVTKLSNLCNLCSYHHHLVHDGDYRVELLATGKFRFKNPRGWVIPEVPSPAKPPDKPLAELELEGWKGKPKWGYEPIDLPLVIDTMWRPRSVLE